MIERRRFKRKQTSTRTMLKSRWQIADAVCLDVSMGGFLIQAHHEFSVGDAVEVALEMPGGMRLNCEGEVVREVGAHLQGKKGQSYGIRIVNLDPATRQRLEAWIDKLADAPARRPTTTSNPSMAAVGRAPGAGTSRAAAGRATGTDSAGVRKKLGLQRILMWLRPRTKSGS